ncbi:MAG: tetratricopeptide repeat protein [Acidimicrobiales bacterium]
MSDELIDEREHLLASLRDLDAELAAGDIDPSDYAALRDSYTARTAEVLRLLEHEDRSMPSRPSATAVRAMPRLRWRTAAVVLAVGLASAGAGLLMANSAGERLPGDEATGNITRNATDRISQAQALVTGGRILDAIRVYDEVLKDDPDQPVALAQRGWLVSRAGLADDGLATIERAIAIDPRYPDAWFFKAMILWRLKDDKAGARAAFEELLALDPPAELADFVRTQALPELETQS